MNLTLPTDSAARKRHPLARGPLAYAPAILAGVAEVCIDGNDKHNPGQPIHHARGKSADHADCIVRHLMDVQDIIAHFERSKAAGFEPTDEMPVTVKMLLTEVNQLAWRALMFGQEIHETYGGAPLAPGARLPEPPAPVLDYSHEFPQVAADAAADDIIGQITGMQHPEPLPGPAGADWRAPYDQTKDRTAWPRLEYSHGKYPSVWPAAGDIGFYFNGEDKETEPPAAKQRYPTEAEARAAYWRWKDSPPNTPDR